MSRSTPGYGRISNAPLFYSKFILGSPVSVFSRHYTRLISMDITQFFALFFTRSAALYGFAAVVLAIVALFFLRKAFFSSASGSRRLGKLTLFSIPVLGLASATLMDLGYLPDSTEAVVTLCTIALILICEGATLWNIPLFHEAPRSVGHTGDLAQSWHRLHRTVSRLTLPFMATVPVFVALSAEFYTLSENTRALVGVVPLVAVLGYILNSFWRNTWDTAPSDMDCALEEYEAEKGQMERYLAALRGAVYQPAS